MTTKQNEAIPPSFLEPKVLVEPKVDLKGLFGFSVRLDRYEIKKSEDTLPSFPMELLKDKAPPKKFVYQSFTPEGKISKEISKESIYKKPKSIKFINFTKPK